MVGHRFLGELCARGGDPVGYGRWRRQVRAAGYCQRPVRLVGGVDHVDTQTGEARTMVDSAGEPDGIILKACGTRRAAHCPPCAEVYRADAYQLLRAGLAGGKGVPETISGHPRLFVTFTAPSFGPVHSSRVRRGRVQVCHPVRPDARCPHGCPRRCGLRHVAGDPALGTPICGDCYDYARAVVWNALAPQLWRRTTIYLRRALARQAGLTVAQLRGALRISYVKVAEYQARGAIHLHAIIRLDAAPPQHDPHQLAPPPAWCTLELLARAIRQAAAQAAVPCPLGGAPIRWGAQLDLRPIHPGSGERSVGQVAGYLAKYATKATEGLGAGLDARIRSLADLERLELPEHIGRLVRACWALGGRRELAQLKLRRWAHMLGFGGHCTTKSRRYATTFAALRAARRAWTARRRHGRTVPLDHHGRLLPPAGMVAVAGWEYAGRGYTTVADAWLAASMAVDHQEARRLAREELSRIA
jgi:Replication initiator protein, pSAM2